MELALVLVPLVLLVFGIVEFSRVSLQKLELTHDARELTRALAVRYDDPGLSLGDLIDDTLDQLLPTQQLQDITSTPVLIACTVDSPADANATVTLAQPVNLAIPFFDTSGFTTITAQAVMPCEG